MREHGKKNNNRLVSTGVILRGLRGKELWKGFYSLNSKLAKTKSWFLHYLTIKNYMKRMAVVAIRSKK